MSSGDGARSVRDALAWLGISFETYERASEITRGRFGNPIVSALLSARDAQGTDRTPGSVLAEHGIDPADPLAAVRAYDERRAKFDN